MKRITHLLIALGIAGLVPAYVSPLAYAQVIPSPSYIVAATSGAAGAACQGVGFASGGGCGDNGAQLNNSIKTATNILSIIVGVIAVIMLIIGGLTYITSNGEASKIAKAKSSIIYALVGLVLIASAESIVHFVIGNVK